MTAKTILIAMVGIALAYPIAMRGLARAVQPKRLRLVDLGAALARDDSLPQAWREMVGSMLETAYSPWAMMNVAVAIPMYAVDRLRGRADVLPSIGDKTLRDMTDELIAMHIASVAAANPVFALLASLELAVIAFFLYPLGKGADAAVIQLAALARAEQVSHHATAA